MRRPVSYNGVTNVATDIKSGQPVEYASLIIGGRDGKGWAIERKDGEILPIRFTDAQRKRLMNAPRRPYQPPRFAKEPVAAAIDALREQGRDVMDVRSEYFAIIAQTEWELARDANGDYLNAV